jgi:hypothetical protein
VLQKPSRFITECPPALFEIWNLEEEPSPMAPATLNPGNKTEFIN